MLLLPDSLDLTLCHMPLPVWMFRISSAPNRTISFILTEFYLLFVCAHMHMYVHLCSCMCMYSHACAHTHTLQTVYRSQFLLPCRFWTTISGLRACHKCLYLINYLAGPISLILKSFPFCWQIKANQPLNMCPWYLKREYFSQFT